MFVFDDYVYTLSYIICSHSFIQLQYTNSNGVF